MKKALFLGIGMACALGFFFFGGVQAVQAKTIELKFAHLMSPMHIQHQKSFSPFCKKVAELTGGQVKIKIYPGGALGRRMQAHDIIQAFSYLLKPILKETICSLCDFH
jgi:TRAP-type C4-dicarboxylate transport system substrate-binding protein